MRAILLAGVIALGAWGASAQMTPGGRFLQNWDLDGDGRVTEAELVEMRGMVFTSFDGDGDEHLDAGEYVYFDEARANDVSAYDGPQRAEMKAVADGMGLRANDANGDGKVSRQEFIAGVGRWRTALDTDGDGVVTLGDFGRRK